MVVSFFFGPLTTTTYVKVKVRKQTLSTCFIVHTPVKTLKSTLTKNIRVRTGQNLLTLKR